MPSFDFDDLKEKGAELIQKVKDSEVVQKVKDANLSEKIDDVNPLTSKRVFEADPAWIPQIEEAIVEDFRNDGFETQCSLIEGRIHDISLTNGNLFKKVVGLQSALKVTMTDVEGKIEVKGGIGLFGQYAIPTAAALLVAWPLAVPAIWGVIKQSKLDDRVIDIVERVIAEKNAAGTQTEVN